MAFISLLLLAILFSTIHISKLYAKGVTNRQINQVGRELVDTIRRDFLVSDAMRITSYIADGHGRICLGNVSYAWNTALTLQGSGVIKASDGSTPVVFSRVADAGGAFCMLPYTQTLPVADTTALLSTTGDGRSLAIYGLTLTKLTPDNRNDGLYDLDIVLGTNDPSEIDTEAQQCKPPADHSSNFEYCSVVDLHIIVRAGGSSR
jgi:hypothetical protein